MENVGIVSGVKIPAREVICDHHRLAGASHQVPWIYLRVIHEWTFFVVFLLSPMHF